MSANRGAHSIVIKPSQTLPSLSVIAAVLIAFVCMAQVPVAGESFIPAFPGAEGYGARTVGGRGGRIVAVTNLDDAGPGSLREAVEAKGARTIVFRVSGTIGLKSPLKILNPYVTIAGQTAPGDGICLRGNALSIGADEVIVRYLRVRFGDESGSADDAVTARFRKNIILDHLSASWSVDECVSVYHCEDVTVQWCLISESLAGSVHAKGSHGYGGIWGGERSSYHHNLLAHHSSRNPRFASASGRTDVRNNVIYNWGFNSAYGGEKVERGRPQFGPSVVNLVANYFMPGPATAGGEVRRRIVEPSSRNGTEDLGKWYVARNVMVGDDGVTADNWKGGVQFPKEVGAGAEVAGRLAEAWPAAGIREETAEAAYESVLKDVGATLPKRDAVDVRVIEETRKGGATYEGKSYRARHPVEGSGPCGIIDSQGDVGGWSELKSAAAPADGDGDGMPDEWEGRFGLDAKKEDAGGDKDGDGYTNLEEWLNGTDPGVFVDYVVRG